MSQNGADESDDETIFDRSSALRKVTAGALGLAALGAMSGSASADCDTEYHCEGDYLVVEECCDGDCRVVHRTYGAPCAY